MMADPQVDELSPDTWYEVTVEARSAAGTTRATYRASTLTRWGGDYLFHIISYCTKTSLHVDFFQFLDDHNNKQSVSFLESVGEAEMLSVLAGGRGATDGGKREASQVEPWAALLPILLAAATTLLFVVLAILLLVLSLVDIGLTSAIVVRR